MTDSTRKKISQKYCPRFGQIAVELGFITEAQVADALASQVHQELAGQGHRLLGEILFEMGSMSAPQIDQVLTALFKRVRAEEG